MKRRTLLKSVAYGTAIGFAGCLNQGGVGGGNGTDSANTDNSSEESTNNNSDDGTTDSNETETSSDNETTDSDGRDGNSTPRPPKQKLALIDHSFGIVSTGCGTKKRAINASFTDHTVRITGMIRGKNSCYTAELQDITCEQGTLTLTVRSFETESSDMCAMCLTNIEYESTYTFDGGLPKRVVVTHNDKQVFNTTR